MSYPNVKYHTSSHVPNQHSDRGSLGFTYKARFGDAFSRSSRELELSEIAIADKLGSCGAAHAWVIRALASFPASSSFVATHLVHCCSNVPLEHSLSILSTPWQTLFDSLWLSNCTTFGWRCERRSLNWTELSKNVVSGLLFLGIVKVQSKLVILTSVNSNSSLDCPSWSRQICTGLNGENNPVIWSGMLPASGNSSVVPTSLEQFMPACPVMAWGKAVAGGGDGARLGFWRRASRKFEKATSQCSEPGTLKKRYTFGWKKWGATKFHWLATSF